MLWNKRLSEIMLADIEQLVANRVSENRNLDFKSELPGRSDGDRKRFLGDVAALANSGGGDIVFGVEEERGADGKTTGIAARIVALGMNDDAEIRRLASMIDSGLDVSLMPKPEFRTVSVPGGAVLVLRVPRSWAAPHMVRESWRFYARHDRQNIPMDTSTLRAAFAASQSWAERVRRFREGRVAQILSDEIPTEMYGPERLVLHLVPFSAGAPDVTVDVTKIKARNPTPIAAEGSWGSRYNVDGVLCTSTAGLQPRAHSTLQFLRDGSVEAVVFEGSLREAKRIWLYQIEDHVCDAIVNLLPIVVDAGVALPIALLVTLVGVKGCGAQITSQQLDRPRTIDREVLFLPDVMIADVPTDPRALVKPLLDNLWQACGYERSLSYDPKGDWTRRARA